MDLVLPPWEAGLGFVSIACGVLRLSQEARNRVHKVSEGVVAQEVNEKKGL